MIGIGLLIIFFLIAVFASILYAFAKRINKYEFFKSKGKKGFVYSLLAVFAVMTVAAVLFGITNALIVFMHLLVALGLCLLVLKLFKAIKNKTIPHYCLDISAVALTIAYLTAGWFSMYNICQTNYFLETKKDIESLRIVQLTDIHLGLTVDAQRLSELVSEINQLNPDLVVITGDFVDDDAEKEDTFRACDALGKIKATYGAYFVYGNHDKGYSNYRGFSGEELSSHLEKNGIPVLEDETVFLNDKICLIGRKDASQKDRKPISDIVKAIPKDCYTIALDHQPNDYSNQADAGIDLVLSGHTHGGHMFPAGPIGVWMGANDAYYGLETRKDTSFIVSSGVSGWAIPFKTATISEYVVIDVKSIA